MKHGALSFDTTGAILHFGKLHNQDIWLGMAPDDFIDGTKPHIPAETRMSTRTFMTPLHYAMVMSFILHALTRAHIAGITYDIEDDYYMAAETQFSNWSWATNFRFISTTFPSTSSSNLTTFN
jgi:hypothetical protein